jgi:DNA ligase (NAD+)
MSQSIEKRIESLREQLNQANHLYYVESRPTISDREYDKLMQELIDLEKAHPKLITPDSPTQRVGEEPIAAFEQVKHAVPMMSIDNTYDEQGIRDFDERVKKGLAGDRPSYVLEPKIDGTAVSLRYEHGHLVLAATRGRGNIGDNITVNARTIKSIPLSLRGANTIPKIVEIRGEIYMDNTDFQRVNKQIQETGEEPYANPRNLTSGTLKRLDPRIVAQRGLRFLAHGSGQVEPLPVDSYWGWIEHVKAWGLPVPAETRQAKDVEEALQIIKDFEKSRGKLPFQTDGMVMKVDSFEQRKRLGATSKAPRWVIAYKYEAEQQQTTLNDVRWQVGKGGNLTPVADLEPVFIGGVTVSKATLHNIDQIKRLDLHIGDTVVVERAGEVIPYVSAAVPEKRPKGAKTVEAPTKCPSCGSPVEKEEGTPYVRCINPVCPDQVKEQLRWFCARGQMDITGLGVSIINQLVDEGVLKTVGDIFRLSAEQIANTTHETEIGHKTAVAIVNSIQSSVNGGIAIPPPLNLMGFGSPADLKQYILWLASPKQLNIKGLGEKTVDQLMSTGLVKTVDDLLHLQANELAALPREVRVGEKTAAKIIKATHDAKSRGLSRVLSALGIPHVGTTVARNVAESFGSVHVMQTASETELHRAVRKSPDQEEDRRKLGKLAADIHEVLKDASVDTRHQIRESSNVDDLAKSIAYLAKTAELPIRLTERRVNLLASAFENGSTLLEASKEEIRDALEAGRIIARSLLDFIHSDEGKHTFEDLKALGVKLTEDRPATALSSPVTGKIVVITGSFEHFKRQELGDRLREMGATVAASVSSKTDILLKGTDAGSKLEQAEELGTILIWDETELLTTLPEIIHK